MAVADITVPVDVTPVPVDVKPGWKTTEFWLTLLAALAPIVLAFTGVDITPYLEPWATTIVSVATAVAYIVGRFHLKAKALSKASADAAAIAAALQQSTSAAEPATEHKTLVEQINNPTFVAPDSAAPTAGS